MAGNTTKLRIFTVCDAFIKCENDQIYKIRESIKWNIREAMKARYGNYLSPPTFYYHNDNQETTPNGNWDMSLGNFGLIPKYVEEYLESITEEEKLHTVKYAMADIAKAVMTANIEIWKHRCKVLYSTDNNNHPT